MPLPGQFPLPVKRTIIAFNFLASVALTFSQDAPPKWGLLGDDADLLRVVQDSDLAIRARVYRVEFINIKRNFATVNMHVTVARAFKGDLKVNDRIVIEFPIDDLPLDPVERDKRLQSLREADIGSLRHCFLERPQDGTGHYSSEWLFVPRFTQEMSEFIEKHTPR